MNFAWKVAPSSANVGNAIVKRDAVGNFTANDITALGVQAQSMTANSVSAVTATTNSALLFAVNTSTTGGASYGVYGESDSNDKGAAGVFGYVPFGNINNTAGVFGRSDSPYGQGVFGTNTSPVSGPTFGGAAVAGLAVSIGGAGVYGIDASVSGLSPVTVGGGSGVGVWGDTGGSGNFGVFGTAADGRAGYFENNSSSGFPTLTVVGDDASSVPFMVSNSATSGFCYVDPAGNLNCSGSKNAVVPIEGGQRTVSLSAIESPKNWFEDFGSAQLSGGSTVITLEPEFAQTVNTGMEYHVFLTPNGDCKGLYVSRKTASSFEVHELEGGSSSVSFDYRIVALRKNFENIRMQDHTKEMEMVKIHTAKKSGPESRTKVDISKLLVQPTVAQPKFVQPNVGPSAPSPAQRAVK